MVSPIANAYADSAGKRAMQEAELEASRVALGGCPEFCVNGG
jgi:hypothetical protein